MGDRSEYEAAIFPGVTQTALLTKSFKNMWKRAQKEAEALCKANDCFARVQPCRTDNGGVCTYNDNKCDGRLFTKLRHCKVAFGWERY
jgi:hypothetical protein